MKVKINIAILLLIIPLTAVAQQSFYGILKEVEQNNTELAAYRQLTDAQKLENKTGIYLQNPEVDAAYLWGTPSAIGNRQDFSIMQPFDFPSAYKHKDKLANIRNMQADYAYNEKRMEILSQAQQLCINLAYLNKLCAELLSRKVQAENIATSYNAAFDKGEASILDRNKANLSLLNAQQELKLAEVDRNSMLLQLQTLNGGKAISITEQEYPLLLIPENFDEWYSSVEAKSPELQQAGSEVEIAKQQIKLNKALALPTFSAGYMLEKVVGESYQGVKVALSIPLWENKNTVRQAKAQNIAMQANLSSVKQNSGNRLKMLYEKAVAIKQTVDGYKQNLKELNNADLLKKALDRGHFNLVEYTMELQFYNDAISKMLNEEHSYYLTLSELRAWEL